VRWGEDGRTDVHLTIVAEGVPFDHDLAEAVEGSEIAGFLDKYRAAGTVEKLTIDVHKIPEEEVCAAEILVSLDHDTFTYAPFPVPMTDVHATVRLVRPLLAKA